MEEEEEEVEGEGMEEGEQVEVEEEQEEMEEEMKEKEQGFGSPVDPIDPTSKPTHVSNSLWASPALVMTSSGGLSMPLVDLAPM